MEETVSLQEIFQILKKRMGMIISLSLLGLLISGLFTFFVIKPKYTSEAQLIVTLPTNENQTASVNDVNANLMMLNTYKDLIKGNAVLNEVAKDAKKEVNFKGKASDLSQMISVNQSQNSQMFSIVATTENAYLSEALANITAKVFQEKVKEILTVDKISVISEGKVNLSPTSPNKKLNLAIGLVLGMMIGVGLAILLEFLDKTVKDTKYVTDTLGLTLLGTITALSDKEQNQHIKKMQQVMKEQMAPKKSEGTATTRRSRSRV